MDIKTYLKEHFLPDWDGYDAEPISDEACEYAQQIYNYFELKPDPGADPDGMVSLEWYKKDDYQLGLSVDKFGNCYYAFIDYTNNDKEHGQFDIKDINFIKKFRFFSNGILQTPQNDI